MNRTVRITLWTIGILFLVVLFNPLYTVKSSHRGVLSTFGKVRTEVISPGLHIKWPLVQSVNKMSVQTQKLVVTDYVYTKDLQSAKVVMEINYDPIPANVAYLYQNVGWNYEDVVIVPKYHGALKDIFGIYDATRVIENRDKVKNIIEQKLTEELATLPINYFQNITIQIADIDYSDEFEKSITEKQIAEQNALRAKNNTIRVEEEAKQTKIKAQAEAEAIRIKAQALERNPKITEYEAIQKWDGKLPTYMLGNSTPFINLK